MTLYNTWTHITCKMSGYNLPLLHALPQQHWLLQPHHPLDPFLPMVFCDLIHSCLSSYILLQEVHKGDQIILPSSSYIVFLPLVKTLLEDLFFYQPDKYNAQRERQTRIICELTGSMRIKLQSAQKHLPISLTD